MNDNGKVYWIWLQQALKYGSNKIRTVNLIYDSAEDFYNAGISEWKMCGCFTKKEIDFMSNCKLDKAYLVLDRCKQLGQDVVTMSDERYPESLRHIANPPCVLYVKGELPNMDNKICIAVVGTRSASLYGVQMAFDISWELAKAGVIVVSGGALGIDESAHKGALQGGGKTVAVLGCGVNYPYLMQNEPLREVIAQNGAIISEFAPDFPAYPSNFPMRNRIISGLSLGTVVVEASKRSGSLITAGLALEQNKDVFAVPVDMNSPLSEGTTALIRDGAKVVTNGEDILCEYRTSYFKEKEKEKKEDETLLFERPTEENYEQRTAGLNAEHDMCIPLKVTDLKNQKSSKNTGQDTKRGKIMKNAEKGVNKHDIKRAIEDKMENRTENKEANGTNYDINSLSLNEQNVYNALKDGKKHVDSIVVKTGLPIGKLLSLLTNMELSGIIESYAGKIYGLKK